MISITSMHLENFKCFEELNLQMRDLNVFAGINNMGKSTTIQALLLLRQAYDMGCIMKGLRLNGDIVSLGIGKDVLYRGSKNDSLDISLGCGGYKVGWSYDYEPNSDFLRLQKTDARENDISQLSLFSPDFTYISAERLGPQRVYSKSSHQVLEKNQAGYRGEFFADYLAEHGLRDKVANDNVVIAGYHNTLIYQMQAWLSFICPGITLEAESLQEVGLVKLMFIMNDGYSVEKYSPLNVGFGLSYVAPVVLSLLKAKPGDLVILENPEAHLHPKGQRKMGELIAGAASGKVQVVVETHSDHLLNGIRLAVKRNVICTDDVSLNYFTTKTINGETVHTVDTPRIRADGSLDRWPDGFFDEWDKAVMELF